MRAFRAAAAGVAMLAAAVGIAGGLAALECYRASDALLVAHSIPVRGAALDPAAAYGLAFRTVIVREPLGPAPAWEVPGSPRRWAIVVHAMGAPRAEGLPLLPVLHRLGITTLVISYRNDPEAPRSPDGLTHLGADEWRDLDAAVGYAAGHGARRVTLIGYSMGGAMVCDFLRRSPRAALVTAAVLDAPVLEWRRPLATAAGGAGLPGPLVGPAESIVSWRTGVDLADEDQLAHADQLRVPIAVLHGTADRVVPVADSRALRAALSGQVQLVEFPGAGHVDSWRSDPARYDAAVRRFLRATARDTGSPVDVEHLREGG
jgi:alpha-beta hydrolase superfamily lysophospholipase